jgi:ATP-dependent RNA helicase RhlE
LSEFKQGKVRVLVATDIAARGLDIVELPHVVNYELPNVPEDYVHRIGRTGRAGQDGAALSLVCVDEHAHLADIEKLLKRQIDQVIVPGYEPDPSIRPEPIKRGGNGGGNGRGRNAANHGGGQRRGRNAPAKAAPGRRPKQRQGNRSNSGKAPNNRNWRSAA